MPETIVLHKGHGLPYSKGLMAQTISATGLPPERAFDLARKIEQRLDAKGEGEIDVAALHELAEEVLLAEEGEQTVRRYANWRRLDRLDRPLVVLLGGTTGVGKSTIATMFAARLGVNRVIATDVIRQVLRAFFTHEAMPTVHYSAFEAGGIAGYRDQAERVGTGITAIVDRAANEAKPVVVEGVHVVPGGVHRARASAACSWRRSWWWGTRTSTAAISQLGPEPGLPSATSLVSRTYAGSRITSGSGHAPKGWQS